MLVYDWEILKWMKKIKNHVILLFNHMIHTKICYVVFIATQLSAWCKSTADLTSIGWMLLKLVYGETT